MALYRASGRVLCVLPAPDRGWLMPVTRRRSRDTRRGQMGPVAPAVPRPYVPPDPGPPPAPFDPGPVDHAFERLMALGRRRRISYWWIFADSQLIEMI